MNKTWAVCGLLALLLGWSSAWAGGTATVDAGPEENRMRLVLEYRGDQLRMETSTQNGLPVILLLRDATLYFLANNLVLDAQQAMRLLGQSVPVPTTGPVDLRRFIALEPTTRNEIHGGIAGKIHLLRYEDSEGTPRVGEIVLSADPRAVELSRAILHVGEVLRRSVETPPIPDEARLRAAIQNRGVLRYGQDFRVLALDANPPAPERFELPSLPLQLPSFGGFRIGG